jgi:PAS domain S-box-containing protein
VILDTSLDGFILTDHEGRVLDWNKASERIFGRQREEMLGQLLGETIVPERLREEHRRELARYAQGRGERLLGERYELLALRSDGAEFPSEVSITHIPGMEPPLFARFVRDITERKEAEVKLNAAKAEADAAAQAMADSAERLRLLTEVISLQVWTAAPSGELDYANQECVDYFGANSGADVLGNAWAQFVHRTICRTLLCIGRNRSRPAAPTRWSSGSGGRTASTAGSSCARKPCATTRARS